MSREFVWFHNSSSKPEAAVSFYEQLLGWQPAAEGPPGMTMFGGDGGPFAAVGGKQGDVGWIPYVQVDDVDAATTRATELGATVLEAKTRGPAGDFSVVRDPGGAAFALWQKA